MAFSVRMHRSRLGALRAASCLALIAALVLVPLALQGRSLASAMVAPLEARFVTVAFPPEDSIDGIIAISGGGGRMETAVRLAIRYPKAKIILSLKGEEWAANVMRSHGISDDRLIIDARSRNTFENAQVTRRLVKPKPGQRYILVTSPSHMPRAMGSFRKAGFSVVPWPVSKSIVDIRPTLAVAKHEWIGLAAYWLMGRTDELFPGPQTQPAFQSADLPPSSAKKAL